MKNIYTLSCFNTCTGEYEIVEFTNKKIYDSCRRTLWNEEYHNDVFNENNIPFSALKCGADKPVEEFHEFIGHELDPLEILLHTEQKNRLHSAIEKLTAREQAIVKMIFWEGEKVPEIMERFSIDRQRVYQIQRRIFKKLKKILKNF